MAQININETVEFVRDLKRLMSVRKIRHKSDAIRRAVHEAAQQLGRNDQSMDFRELLGIAGKGRVNPNPKFKDRASLWEK